MTKPYYTTRDLSLSEAWTNAWSSLSTPIDVLDRAVKELGGVRSIRMSPSVWKTLLLHETLSPGRVLDARPPEFYIDLWGLRLGWRGKQREWLDHYLSMLLDLSPGTIQVDHKLSPDVVLLSGEKGDGIIRGCVQ